jgi:hypothetical protein
MPRSTTLAARALLAPLAVFAALLALFAAFRQDAFWGDGKFFVLWLQNERWGFYHLAYLPAGHLVRLTLGRFLGWDPPETLFFVSHAAGALAGTFVYAAARRAGLSLASRVAAVALLATTPVVWFYATSIEVHALQAAAAAAAVYVFARAWEAGRFGGDALLAAGLLIGVAATHLSGIAWAPALLFVAVLPSGARRPRVPRRLLPALLVLALAAAAFAAIDRGGGADHLELGMRSWLARWNPGIAWRELAVPAGIVHGLLLVAGASQLRAARRLGRPGQATLVLYASFLPYAFLVDIAEHGAYFVSLLPAALLWIARWLDRARGPGPWALVLAALVAQGALAWTLTQGWVRQADELPTWAHALRAEAGARTAIFTTDMGTAARILRHSDLFVFTPVAPDGTRLALDDPALLERARGIVVGGGRLGYRFAVTWELFERERESALVALLVELLGAPARGPEGAVYVFPPP